MARRHFPLLMDVGMAGATRAGKTTARRGTVISSENLSPLLVQFAARADNSGASWLRGELTHLRRDRFPSPLTPFRKLFSQVEVMHAIYRGGAL